MRRSYGALLLFEAWNSETPVQEVEKLNDKDRKPKIHPTAHIDDTVTLGDWTVVHENVEMYGDVTIGRAGWILPNTIIGGGQKELGSLTAGDFFHVGMRGFINIAHSVSVGDGVGLGMDTKLFTHGGYLNQLEGFPFERGSIDIGSEVWIPNAIVLPNVRIGHKVVIAAMSLVNMDIPSYCLAGGIPVKILKEYRYARELDLDQYETILNIIHMQAKHYGVKDIRILHGVIDVGETTFYPRTKMITGPVSKDTERVKDLFRRHGVRFRFYDKGGIYEIWD